ncbi:lactate/malate family dehydrogenase [Microbacterium album]|uniref:Lactate/malate dehydrogenase N-terminal domain-containing protein n=1 Tax=Microbacterium album TaxID=2053191 RepID=A0A917MM83_9MICO|nr:hypothetical protein [Microbacterium album]GGH46866.1 hypothetical protein GCM10010921_23210 [Microbacterium album]
MTSVTIFGAAGGIGASIASELVGQRLFDELRLVDPRVNVLEADRIDLIEAALVAGGPALRVVVDDGTASPEAPSELVICAATRGERLGESRSAAAAANWALLRSLAPALAAAAGDTGLILLVTNPVDAMAALLSREPGIGGPGRVLGYSLNDTTRLRAAIGRELSVDPARVDALALGLHGEQVVPLFSRVRVDDEPVALDAGQRARIVADFEGWFGRWHRLDSGRTSARATAAGVAELVRRLRDGRSFPTSTATDPVASLPGGSFVALPVTVAGGSAVPDDLDCDEDEHAALAEAALTVKRLVAELTAEAASGPVSGAVEELGAL